MQQLSGLIAVVSFPMLFFDRHQYQHEHQYALYSSAQKNSNTYCTAVSGRCATYNALTLTPTPTPTPTLTLTPVQVVCLSLLPPPSGASRPARF